MNVLYTALCYPPRIGGGEIHLHCLAKQMADAGHHIRVINQWSRWRRDWLLGTTLLSDPAKSYTYEGIHVEQIGFGSMDRFRMLPWVISYYGGGHILMGTAVRRIAAIMKNTYAAKSESPDLVHALRMGREFLVQTALDYSRERKIPFILTPLHHPRWSGVLYKQYDRIYREADALVALTDYEKEMLAREKGIDPERIHVTGIGPVLAQQYSVDEFREKNNLHDPYVLFLGRHVEHKGYRALLEAAPIVWRDLPDLKFVFVGSHTDRSSKVFAGQTDERIVNLGAVDLRTKTAALAGCEVMCLPSTQESFGGVYTEAWTFKKPVIGGRIPPIASVIDDGKDGFLSSQNPAELAEQICFLVTEPEVSRQLGEAGQAKVLQRFTWEKIAERTCRMYRAVLNAA